MKCRCGKSISSNPGFHPCACGARNTVVKNGDAGVHYVIGRPGRDRGFILKDGELKKRG